MQLANWIALLSIAVTIFLAFFIGYKKGDFKNIELYVTPSNVKSRIRDNSIFKYKGVKLPAVGIINLFSLPDFKHKKICFHIYISVENLSINSIEDLSVTVTYPRKYNDEDDPDFWLPTSKKQDLDFDIVYIDDNIMQVSYRFSSLHPKSIRQVIHPIVIPIDECYTEGQANPMAVYISDRKGFSFEPIKYAVSAKNLKVPVQNYFWLINVIGTSYKNFFNREKKFLNAITRDYKYPRYVFEMRNISTYKEGKTKKDILVVPNDKLNITYSHFPPLKEPDGFFNFAEDKT